MSLSLFYNHVTVLDYAFLESTRGVVGDSLIVNVEFIGSTNGEGVIYDFSLAKKKVKEIIDLECDHRLVVPNKASDLTKLEMQESCSVGFGSLRYQCPREALCVIDCPEINLTSLAKYLEEIILPHMPTEVSAVKIELESEKNTADGDLFFSYSHGLKQHYGNCQRLLHGHRSTLKVFRGGKRDGKLESWLIKDTFDANIHFAFWDNIINKEEISALLPDASQKYGKLPAGSIVEIAYESDQGEFQLFIDSAAVHVLPIETTVENLSSYFLQILQHKLPQLDNLEVWAFEGIGKGAKSSV